MGLRVLHPTSNVGTLNTRINSVANKTAGSLRCCTVSWAVLTANIPRLGQPDGIGPGGTLARDSNGNLYGTARDGGLYDDGTVWEIMPWRNNYRNIPISLVDKLSRRLEAWGPRRAA